MNDYATQIQRVLHDLNFFGISQVFTLTVQTIARMAAHDATALVQGETGTGKELAARAVHYLSARRDRAFVPVNCGAIPESLLESEFFGCTKGAFTDAKSAKSGLIEYAEGGTLFLDEVECLSPKGQAVLLRFLQDQSYRPLGGQLRKANVRLVAASNRDLLAMAKEGEFRLDLYYRLALLTLTIPPLRERAGDPELLARHFVEMGCRRFSVPAKSLHYRTLEWFGEYYWPGNVRELENLIYREVLLSESDEILIQSDEHGDHGYRDATDHAKDEWLNVSYQCAKKIAVSDFEQRYLNNLLTQTKGNISAAARLAGKERRSFCRLLQKNGIDKADYRLGDL